MARPADDLEELRQHLCPAAAELTEGGVDYLHLPHLKLPSGDVVDTLLRLTVTGDGYATRLYLPNPVPGKGQNWTPHRVLDRQWFTWSLKDISPDGRLVTIIRNHFRQLA